MPRILIVDDDATIRMVMIRALKAAGHEVFSATNGREGLWHSQAIKPDLIVADLFMPDQEGVQMITQIHGQFPHVAILAISGSSVTSRQMLSVALQLGATTILEKPFDKETLLAMVERTLRMKPPQAGFEEHDAGPILPESH